MAVPRRFQARLIEVTHAAEDVATFTFEPQGVRLRHRPGQFVHLALDPFDPTQHWPESRVFSVASGRRTPNRVRLCVAAKGPYTQRMLRDLRAGDTVWMKGPYGDFLVEADATRETVLVAGGTGVAPFWAFVEDAVERGLAGVVWLFYGARDLARLVGRDVLEEACQRLEGLRLRCFAEHGAGDGVLPGRPVLDVLRAALRNAREATYYLSGPPAMIQSLRAELEGPLGATPAQIRIDDWGDAV